MTHFAEAAEALFREAAAGNPALPWQRLLGALQRSTGAATCSMLVLQGKVLVPVASSSGGSAGRAGPHVDPAMQARLDAMLAAREPLYFRGSPTLEDPCEERSHGTIGRAPMHHCVGMALRAGPDAAGIGVMLMEARAPVAFDATAIERLRAAAGMAGACLTLVDRLRGLGATGSGQDFPVPAQGPMPGVDSDIPPLAVATDDFQRRLVATALDRSGGNWTQAARLLHVDRANLHRLVRRLEKASGAPAASPR